MSTESHHGGKLGENQLTLILEEISGGVSSLSGWSHFVGSLWRLCGCPIVSLMVLDGFMADAYGGKPGNHQHGMDIIPCGCAVSICPQELCVFVCWHVLGLRADGVPPVFVCWHVLGLRADGVPPVRIPLSFCLGGQLFHGCKTQDCVSQMVKLCNAEDCEPCKAT